MADNVPITAGTGTDVATDQVTGTLEHVQLFKLAYSADGSRTLVPVDADGVLVNLGANNDVTVTSGTIAATQSGTWNVNNVSGTVSLPTGASTSAKQPALGTAGSPSSDVITVQGVTSMTALSVAQATAANLNCTEASASAIKTSVELIDDGVATTGSAITTKGMAAVGTDGTNARILKTDTSGELQIDVLTVPSNMSVNIAQVAGATVATGNGTAAGSQRVSIASDSTGTVAVTQATASSLNAQVVGAAADAATVSGNPVSLGATARTANRTSVTDGQAVRVVADKQGRLITNGAVRDLVSHQHTQIASSSSETTIVTAGGAGVFNDITSLVITNQTATAVNVTIKDSTAGTTRMIIALAANGGAVITPSIPIPQLASANNNWTATLSSSSVTVNFFVQFVKNV